jgi:transcriptional regulator with XRE-family HTH domain
MTQRELASRLGCRQATIARWERGDRLPSYEDVQEVADACGLQLDTHLLPEDRSWWPQVATQLERPPSERVRRLTPAHASDIAAALAMVTRAGAPVIVIGEVAGALHGWPLVLGANEVEVCVRPEAVPRLLGELAAAEPSEQGYELPSGARLVVTAVPPGTAGYNDLSRGVQIVDLDGAPLQVAGLLDLLRIADASLDPDSRRRALAYRAVLDVQRAQKQARFADHAHDEDRIRQWLAKQTPTA